MVLFRAGAIVLLAVFGFPWQAFASGDGFSMIGGVTRIQARRTVDSNDLSGFTFSSFLVARNKTFILAILDYEKDEKHDSSNGRAEVNLGRPFSDTPFGWLIRGKTYYKNRSVAAGGLQLNFNKLPILEPALKSARVKTFVQFLENSEDPYFGNYEILHYYSLELIPKRFAVRGYNVFYETNKNTILRHSWADFLYSLNDIFDIYYRLNDVGSNNEYLGPRGTSHYFGVRVSWH